MGSASEQLGIGYWRERILRNMLLVSVSFGLLAFVPGFFSAALDGKLSIVALDVGVFLWLLTLIAARGLSLDFRAASLVTVLAALGCLLLLEGRLVGLLFMMTNSIVAAVLLGQRWAWGTVAFNAFVFFFVGLEYGAIFRPGPYNVVGSRFAWFALGCNFVFLNGVTTASVSLIVQGLQRSLEKARAIGLALEREQRSILETHQQLKSEMAERHRAEQERMRLAMAVEQAAEVIVIVDTIGRVVYVNPAYERLTGYTAAEALRLNLRDGEGEIRRDEIWAAIDRGEVWTGRVFDYAKDGREYHAEATVSPLRDDRGEVISHVAVIRDITREMQMEEQLRRSQKLEAIGTLAGGIAHDFNNILMSVSGFTELTKAGLPPGSPLQGNLDEILRGSQRARDLVHQILAFSRQLEAARQPVAVGLLLKEALRLLRASIPASIEIASEIAPDAGMVFADPTQIHQVILNLCTNAFQAMEQHGGVLRVRLARAGAAGPAWARHAGLREDADCLCLSVADTGVGMPKEVLGRIFDPFFTTKEPGKGTGLGLATVHGIVTALDGEIAVSSEPGQGSEFRVFLPRIEPVFTLQPGPVEMDPQGAGERVLFVDDEPVLLELGEELLRGLGYRPSVCARPRDALQALQADPRAFDCLVTDQTMPEMSGVELTGEVRKFAPRMPIVMTSGYSDLLTPERLRETGVTAFIQKPFTRGDLARILRHALNGHGTPGGT